jgi:hypothetical protein
MEGAQLPWRVQKVNMSHGPVGNYTSIKFPLPDPPKGMEWRQNKETKEWKLEPIIDAKKCLSVRSVSCEEGDEVEGEKRQRSCSVSSADSSSSLSDSPASDPTAEQFVEHTVLPTDTMQGLCLKYKVSVIKLRQVNRFSGSNLLLAPAKLKIPLADGLVVHRQDVESPEYKIHFLRAELPKLSEREAKSYLEIADWNLPAAIREAREDISWGETQQKTSSKGIVGTYLDVKDQRRLKSKNLMFDEDENVETAIPVLDGEENSSKPSTFTQSAMKFFNGQEESGMEMKSNPMMVPLLAADHQMS